MLTSATESEFTGARKRAHVFIEHRHIQRLIITLILINAALLGLETWPDAMAGGLILAVDKIMLTVFVIEIAHTSVCTSSPLLARSLESV